ncbi:V-type ATP synthase subunit F [Cryobacterium sp. CG_9.6]|uniref:V-type ATP synthase subunit F n=1 Tax=Cryobacterium sp. CG_9.6 TaxID=2760710 RepID=UPI0024764AD3|nr:V-type ATP synthase subunit F [Cryobacterium sp. CG_9.6]MDH6235352.1 vacuolar-type H+-ATPase subunit F/Vma7 [Cryobacterium sp. CG_9.6]
MSTVVAALGERVLIDGFALAGVRLYSAETDDEVRRVWATLLGQTGLVIVTPHAARALGAAITDPHAPLTAVLPSVLPSVLLKELPS